MTPAQPLLLLNIHLLYIHLLMDPFRDKLFAMSDFYDDYEDDYVIKNAVQPHKYNIVLTREGEEISFDFPPATSENIARFGYIQPHDPRCSANLVNDEEDMYGALEPILGTGYRGDLSYHTRKQTIISLHDTAILGYQRQTIIDPRLSNEIAVFWEVYLDQRIFPQAAENDWRSLMVNVIITEKDDEDADKKLAEDIKDRLLEQALDDSADDAE
ncbi:MAG: hypothetical protein CMF60_01750 [Magnetococcales bacterium]|nr:hypothetical protein [Magnetococcales bacterium]